MNLHKKRLYIFLIIPLIIGIYFNTFKNAFQFDDIIHIVNNERIKQLSNLSEMLTEVFNRSILFATFTINYHISGQSTFSYHITNILLHFGVSILIYLLLISFTTHYPSPTTPFLASIIFALHPINTESVTYIISRSSILSTFFYLLSLLMFIKGNEDSRVQGFNGSRFSKFIFFALSLSFFILALGSKEDAVTLPIMALIYYLIFSPNKGILTSIKKNLNIIMLLAVLSSIYPILRYFKYGMIGTGEATGIYTSYSYLLTELNVIVFYYLKLVFIPINLNVDPDIRPATSLFNFSTLTALLVIFLMIISSFKYFKRDPLIAFSILWFFVALLPTSSIFPLLDAAAEHRVYLSAVGFSIFFANTIGKIQVKKKYIFSCLFILILLSFSLCTIKRNFIWKNKVSLWEDTVRKSPSKARTHAALGLAYKEEKGLIDEAIRQYRIALGIKPLYFDALNNLGIALDKKGDMDGALQKYELALLIKPNSPELHNNIAIIHAKKGEMDKAIAKFKKTLEIAPNYTKARENLEIALKGMTNFEGSTSVDSYR